MVVDIMDVEFGGGKFKCLFCRLMWSGLEREDIRDLREVSMNLKFYFWLFFCFKLIML